MPNTFPYEAMNPMTVKMQKFESLEDVYEVLLNCYDKCIKKGFTRLGEALKNQAVFIVNDELLIDQDMQLTIKKHQFCKQFNCPPYPSLNETPASIVDDFMIIEQETTQFATKDKNGE